MKREVLYPPMLAGLMAVLALATLPASAGAEENSNTEAVLNAAGAVDPAAQANPLRRRWAQMSDEERARFLERRRAQAADQGSSIRERLAHLSPRQKAHLRQRLANAKQRPHRPLPPHARRRVQAGGR